MTETDPFPPETIYDPAHPITEPGVYVMTEEQYHADPCATPSLSNSIAKRSQPLGSGHGTARHMWQHQPKLNPPNPDEQEKAKGIYDLGSAFHALVLGKGAELVIVNANDWRTTDAKHQRDAAYRAGKQPLLKEQHARAQAMVRAAWPQIMIRDELHHAMAKGKPERVLIWREETPHGSILCRAMLDWLPAYGQAFPDWKTTGTSPGPDDYSRTLFDIGADMQDAFYQRGIKAVLDRDAHLIFPAIETSPPHCLMVHRIGASSAAMARRRVQYAINLFALCLRENVWPGFPIDTAIQDAPPWHESKWIAREDAGMTGDEFNKMMIEWAKQAERHSATYDPAFADDFNLPAHGEERSDG